MTENYCNDFEVFEEKHTNFDHLLLLVVHLGKN